METGTQKAVIDRRIGRRLAVSFPVKYKVYRERNGWRTGTSADISGGGLKMLTDVPLKIDNTIKTEICPLTGDIPIRNIYRVMWCSHYDARQYRIGLKTIEFQPPMRSMRYICELLLQKHLSSQ